MDIGLTGAARIGPNAITRVAEALGTDTAPAVFRAAGLESRLLAPPECMVSESEVIALHRALHAALGAKGADDVSRAAGRFTGAYLLSRRIPRPLQWLLRHLPTGAAAAVLARAIGRHAWTFTGSGRFRLLQREPMRVEIAGGPIARATPAAQPVCGYYATIFETLFRALVHPETEVVELACEATGAPACVFELRWPANRRARLF